MESQTHSVVNRPQPLNSDAAHPEGKELTLGVQSVCGTRTQMTFHLRTRGDSGCDRGNRVYCVQTLYQCENTSCERTSQTFHSEGWVCVLFLRICDRCEDFVCASVGILYVFWELMVSLSTDAFPALIRHQIRFGQSDWLSTFSQAGSKRWHHVISCPGANVV